MTSPPHPRKPAVNSLTRRDALVLGATMTLSGVAGCIDEKTKSENCVSRLNTTDEAVRTEGGAPHGKLDVVGTRGAIYVPARAFNLYQMWHDYEPAVVERDFDYATDVNLNAIRTWLCYEAWVEDSTAQKRALDHFLEAAEDRGLSVLLGLFDGVGMDPTQKRLTNTNPITATGVSSPSKDVLQNPHRWETPKQFVAWFMAVYGDDDRLLGIEVMNEPGWKPYRKRFAHEMFETLKRWRASIPLTVGSTSIANNTEYVDWGSEIIQFHYNFPSDRATYWDMLRQVNELATQLDEPVWLTEWQRARHGRGFTSEPKAGEKSPNYSSLAPLIHRAGLGNFFWSLMVKPAWVQPQRKNGVLSGLFHEDGAVWSLDDARALKAMSGDPAFDGEERKEWPEWAARIPEQLP